MFSEWTAGLLDRLHHSSPPRAPLCLLSMLRPRRHSLPENLLHATHCARHWNPGIKDTAQKRQRACWLTGKEVKEPNTHTHCAECGGPRESDLKKAKVSGRGAVTPTAEGARGSGGNNRCESPRARETERLEHNHEERGCWREQGQQAQLFSRSLKNLNLILLALGRHLMILSKQEISSDLHP